MKPKELKAMHGKKVYGKNKQYKTGITIDANAKFGDKNQKKREKEFNTRFDEMIEKSNDPKQIEAIKKLRFKE